MKRSMMLAAAITTIAGQAHTLSCMRPDPIETFQTLAEAEESYFVLHGVLSFDEQALPQGVGENDRAIPDPIPARFVGKGLTKEGFTNTYVSDVNLQIGCAGAWCGSASSGTEAVYFVRASEPPVTMTADACGGRIFYEPGEAVLDMLTSCMQGGTCSPILSE